jgi:RimJ/RimL family protein N-acetyltransferase
MLRPLGREDLDMTRAWRNHPDSRRWFNTTAELSEEGHRAWFASYEQRDNDYVFITEIDGVPVAQSALYDVNGSAGEFGRLLVSPEARGNGLSHIVIGLTLRCADEILGLEALRLEVKADNDRAISAYQRAGFELASNELGTDGALVMMRARP